MSDRTSELDRPCPACGAGVSAPCHVPIAGVDTTGWTHDARILAPVVVDIIRARVADRSSTGSDA